jgi:activator of HSP90 ATPase
MVHSEVPVDQADEIEQGWTDYYWEPLKTYFKKKQ